MFRFAFLMILLLWTGASAAAEIGPRFELWAVVNAQGAVDELDWSDSSAKLNDALRTAIGSQLTAIRFKPAARDGHAVAIRTWITGTTRLEPVGDELSLSVSSVRAGPRATKWRPPRVPISALRTRSSADVLASFRLDADGRPQDIAVELSAKTKAGYASAVRKEIELWRFELEQIEGEPVLRTIHVPIRFFIEYRGEVQPLPFHREPDAGEVLAPGQTGLWEVLEITGERRP